MVSPKRVTIASVAGFAIMASMLFPVKGLTAPAVSYNIIDYGATGDKTVSSGTAIQSAIDACAGASGGTVYFPPGDYTSGTIHLHDNVRLYLESGATLFASRDKGAYDKRALIYGENLNNITIEGRGIIDGQAEFIWEEMRTVDPNFKDTTDAMKAMGKPLLRTYPVGPTQHAVLLVECKNVVIRDVSFIRGSSWTISPWGCERVVIDGVYISTSVTEGVWADGIDPDCCRDVRISNCTIETGDDCISLKASNNHGEPRPCENVTITNCCLTTASTALKIGDELYADVRHVTMDNCVIRGTNRGLGIMIRGRGNVSDVVFSNLTMECIRHDWFWWGDGEPFLFIIEESIYSRLDDKYKYPLGKMSDILITDVMIRAQGTGKFYANTGAVMENITLDRVTMELSSDLDKIQKAVNALSFERARDITLKDVRIRWGAPQSDKWDSALLCDDIIGLAVEGFSAGQTPVKPSCPVVTLSNVKNTIVRGCTALPETQTFIRFTGSATDDVRLMGNDFHRASSPVTIGSDVPDKAVVSLDGVPAGK